MYIIFSILNESDEFINNEVDLNKNNLLINHRHRSRYERITIWIIQQKLQRS